MYTTSLSSTGNLLGLRDIRCYIQIQYHAPCIYRAHTNATMEPTGRTAISSSLPFGAVGWVPIPAVKTKPKMAPRAHTARYIYPLDANYIPSILTDMNNHARHRLAEFHHIDPNLDPCTTLRRAFKFSYILTPPHHITPDTPSPASPHHARTYPDAADWTRAHDSELDRLYTQQAITWLIDEETLPDAKPIPLTMTYKYSR